MLCVAGLRRLAPGRLRRSLVGPRPDHTERVSALPARSRPPPQPPQLLRAPRRRKPLRKKRSGIASPGTPPAVGGLGGGGAGPGLAGFARGAAPSSVGGWRVGAFSRLSRPWAPSLCSLGVCCGFSFSGPVCVCVRFCSGSGRLVGWLLRLPVVACPCRLPRFWGLRWLGRGLGRLLWLWRRRGLLSSRGRSSRRVFCRLRPVRPRRRCPRGPSAPRCFLRGVWPLGPWSWRVRRPLRRPRLRRRPPRRWRGPLRLCRLCRRALSSLRLPRLRPLRFRFRFRLFLWRGLRLVGFRRSRRLPGAPRLCCPLAWVLWLPAGLVAWLVGCPGFPLRLPVGLRPPLCSPGRPGRARSPAPPSLVARPRPRSPGRGLFSSLWRPGPARLFGT